MRTHRFAVGCQAALPLTISTKQLITRRGSEHGAARLRSFGRPTSFPAAGVRPLAVPQAPRDLVGDPRRILEALPAPACAAQLSATSALACSPVRQRGRGECGAGVHAASWAAMTSSPYSKAHAPTASMGAGRVRPECRESVLDPGWRAGAVRPVTSPLNCSRRRVSVRTLALMPPIRARSSTRAPGPSRSAKAPRRSRCGRAGRRRGGRGSRRGRRRSSRTKWCPNGLLASVLNGRNRRHWRGNTG